VLAEAQAKAREQLWHPVARILEEHLAELASKLRLEMAATLNQSVRRLRVVESEAQWSQALVEAVASFCTRALVFTVGANTLRLQGVELGSIPVSSAPAFAEVIGSRDSVVAMRSSGELSTSLAGYLTETPEARCFLFPILNGDRVAAVLYADGDVDINALEMLASVAGAMLAGRERPAGLVGLASATAPSRSRLIGSSDGAEANGGAEANRAVEPGASATDLRARRVARVRVAEMRLYHSRAVESGRLNRDLYQALKPEIDARRESFHQQFLVDSPAAVDYLHVEILRTLANDDPNLLGRDYPGPLV
jgi:hypothetical protein